MIKVICGIIHKEDKILLCRKKEGKPLAGYWEFPGGKLEPQESMEEGLKRELLEELQIKVDILKYAGHNIHHYENLSIELHAFHCNCIEDNITLTDHDAYAWVRPEELIKYKLAPADRPLLSGEWELSRE